MIKVSFNFLYPGMSTYSVAPPCGFLLLTEGAVKDAIKNIQIDGLVLFNDFFTFSSIEYFRNHLSFSFYVILHADVF